MWELALLLGGGFLKGPLGNWGYGELIKKGVSRLGLPDKTGAIGTIRKASAEKGAARAMERAVWKGFWGQKGFRMKWAGAQAEAAGIFSKAGINASTGAISKAAGAALGSNLLHIGTGYIMWGTLPPMLADMAIGGFNALSDLGRQARLQGPNVGVRFVDTQQAATMRQAGLQAIYESGMGGHRNMLGTEASLFHRH